MSDSPQAQLAALLGLTEDSSHFLQALTHPSHANETGEPDNQRLEFLGDSVLGFCTSQILYERFPDAAEGELTRMRANLVNAEALAKVGRDWNLSESLRLGRGADGSGLRRSMNVVADAVEALIAAAYLDVGIEQARRVCEDVVRLGLEDASEADPRDAKSELQERLQGEGLDPPTYVVVTEGGPAHARWFEVEARSDGRVIGTGRGRSKRLAERAAAAVAIGKT